MAMRKIPDVAVSSTLPTASAPSLSEKLQRSERLKKINGWARRLFLAYPSTDYEDAESSMATYIGVLEGYSDVIVDHVTSPKTGLQRRLKFPPRVAELVVACDEAAVYLEKRRQYQNWGQSAARERAEFEARQGTPAERKAIVERVMARMGDTPVTDERGRVSGFATGQASSWDAVVGFYASNPQLIEALTGEVMSRKSKAG